MSYIGTWTNDVINECINQFKKSDNRKKITINIIDPIVKEISSKLLPYFATLLILQIVIVIMIIYILTSTNSA